MLTHRFLGKHSGWGRGAALSLAFILTFIALCGMLSGCSAPQAEGDGAGDDGYCRFTDSTGREVVLDKAPERVAVLFSSFADIWRTAGGEIAVTVGETVERGFAEEGVLLVDDGAGKTINTELLISYEPDFVILSSDIAAQAECADFLCEVGIPVAEMRVESFADYLAVLKIFTDVTGNSEAYETYGAAQEREIEKILSSVPGASGENTTGDEQQILFIRAASSNSATKAKTASENFVCAMLNELGTHNIAEDAPVLLDGLSIEAILKADPDVIFFTAMGKEEAAKAYMEEVMADKAWQSLTAVKEGRTYFLPKELFHFKPNARWAEAYQYLYDLLYTK